MRLKSLEITGFKSFPERVELKFPRGITAIVGPNGCGKSNVADAIRWVLGEQSAKSMRGAKMEELMFSGTARRKALNFAEVSLVLEDADKCLPLEYHEVVITRRMYRSGEGEYYLNKTPCRLKDIHELFWDTGIGTDTYSLVGQGRVEQIINARPGDRRELLEEAAEIYKYKQQKKEAGYKLEELKINMIRLEDLLAELGNRQNSLSYEAEQARKYLGLQLQFQERERKLLELRWEKNQSAVAKIGAESARLQELVQTKRADWQRMAIDLEQLVQDEKGVYRRLEEKQKDVQHRRAGVDELRHGLGLAQEQRKFAREKSIIKDEASRELRLRLEGLETSIRQNKEELRGVLREQEQSGQKAAEVQARLKTLRQENHAAAREKLKEQMAEFRSRQAVMEHSARDNGLRREELKERIGELEKRQLAKRQETEKWGDEEKNNQIVFFRLKTEQEDLDRELALHKKRCQDYADRLEEQKEKQVQSSRELERRKSRLKFLQESEEELSSYAGGVRAVMHASSRDSLLPGIHGPIANLIGVSQEFEKAVEVALGAAQQFLVVEDDRAARGAIAYLKEKKAGRATFLPLNLLKIPRPREIPQTAEGLLGVASQIITVEEKFRKAIDYLLGGVLVTRDLKTALQILRQDKRGWRIVTLDGEMVTPGGAISGGLQAGKRSGFLQRKRELAALQDETEYLEKILGEEKDILEADRRKLAALEEELNFLATEQKVKEKEILERGRVLESCRFEGARAAKELLGLEKDKTSVEIKDKLLKEQGQKILFDLEKNLKIWEEKKEDLERIGRQAGLEENEGKNLEEELLGLRVKFSALQEKESSCQGFLRRQEEEKVKLETLEENLSAELAAALAEINRLETEESNLAKGLEKERNDLGRAEKALSQLAADRAALGRSREGLEISKGKEQAALERAERRYYQLNLEKTRLAEEGRYLEEHYLEKYGASPPLAPGPEIGADEEQLQMERDRLAGQMQALGDINRGAIDEYAGLGERIEFLESQLGDLMQGEKGTRQVMQELDQEMEKRFLQTLLTVEKNFLDIFVGLFGGGQAFLKLTDPGQVLESGVEIVAQPPGKKLQNISLLSGGEKALTSIALLFSLLQYKPVPFCVLDEIDSSLDGSNIERFLDFLKKFTHDTQFILITHRQKTMDAADVLYGVTMEEQGISKVLSLNLTEKVG